MHRRSLFGLAAGTAVAATADTSRRLGRGDVDRFEAEHARIVAQDQALGGAQRVENDAVELAMRIKSALSRGVAASMWVRTKLYCLASDVTCSAAFAAIDAQARTRARGHLDAAVTYAGLSGNSETQYHVWNHLSIVAGQRNDHAEVSAAADAAKSQSIAKKDLLYASLAHLRNARAHAGRQDRSAALRALRAAEGSFDRHASVQRPRWIEFFDGAELDGLTSIVWLRLGEPDRAEYHLHRALGAIQPERVRNRTYYIAHLSLSQARQGDFESACHTADQAAELLGCVRGSKRTTDTLASVRKLVVSSGTKEPSVLDWAERAQAWI